MYDLFHDFPEWALKLAPLAEFLLRVYVGLALVPHGLRAFFGFFAGTINVQSGMGNMARRLDEWGWKPGALWAPLIAFVQLVCGPLLALGFYTELVAVPIFIFLVVANFERWKVGRYFWNTLGLEYTVMWTLGAFYFMTHGAGAWSLDHLLRAHG